MAGTTIGAQPALVGIIRRVAGGAVLRRGLEVRKGAGIDVALRTQNLGMFPGQMERDAVVIEFVTIGVHPIVTGQAIAAKIQAMGLHEI